MRRAGQVGAAVALALAALADATGASDGAGVGLPLRAVHFESDAWVDTEGLRALLPLARGEPVTAEQLVESRRILERADIFRSIAVEARAEDGAAVVVFRVKRKRVITDLSVHGYDHLGWREVYRLLRVRTGSFYDGELIEAARQRVLTRYRQIGFPRATVSVDVRKRAGEVVVRFAIDEGEPTTVAAVTVTGNTGVAPTQLERALRPLVGKPYGRATNRTGEERLLGVLRDGGYYDAQIDGEWVPSGDAAGTLWFQIDAGPRTEIDMVGNEAKSRKKLLGLMDLRTRLIVTDGTWRELARRMRRLYRENGYYRATVRVGIEEGDPRRVVFTIDEGRRYAVRAVRFIGNAQMPEDALRDEMNTQPARLLPWPRRGAFVRAIFDDDLRRLWFFYREQGYASAEIVDAPVDVDDASGAIEVTIVIAEGPRTVVEAVRPPDLSELPPPPPELELVPETPLLPAALERDTKRILAALRRGGYVQATVEPVVTRRSAGDVEPAVVDWAITRGERRAVGAVIVQGNVETRNDIVLRELPFRRGDPLDPEALQTGQDRVYQLGTYRSVAVKPLEPPAPVQDVGVEVVPRPPGSIQWGAGYNTRDGITGFGEISYDNVGHRARRVMLRGQGSVDPTDLSSSQFLALIGYRVPQFRDSPWTWNVDAIGERTTKTIDQYSILRGSLGSGFSRALLPRLRVSAELQFERDDVFDVKPQSFLDVDEGVSYTTSVSPAFIYDGRDEPFAPTRGFFESVNLRYAPPGISTVQFGAVNLQHSQAFPLSRWLSFIYSGRLGYGRALSGAPVLPIRERYFLGGSTTVRGFAENGIGPTDDTRARNVLGGDLAMVLSLEWRVPLPIVQQLGAAVFNDNGGLFLTQCDRQCQQQNGVLDNAFTLKNFRHSAGPGLRYMTPVGPISLDYGFKLDRRSGESIGEVHFSISGTF